ncbi:YggT family protein [Legionella dresdenensis]|uniref:YggT family protein n=1 Tax=Legionella dresdenensis TaxID=450200 RepID=A0ABV8CDZ3_9GAMM
MSGFYIAGAFLFNTIFSLIIYLLWLRIFLRYYRVSSLHPFGRLIFTLSDPLVNPIERLVYRGKKRLPQYDWCCLGLIIVVEIIKFLLLGLIALKILMPPLYLLLYVAADLIIQPLDILFYALLIRIIISFFNTQYQHHPVIDIVMLITAPLIKLGLRIVPNISGFDFGPYIVLIMLKVITLFIRGSLPVMFM